MKPVYKAVVIVTVLVVLVISLLPALTKSGSKLTLIPEWEQMWGPAPDGAKSRRIHVDTGTGSIPGKPEGVRSVTISFKLPQIGRHDGLYISKLHAQNVRIAMDGREIYRSAREFKYDVYRILLPLRPESSGKQVQIEADSTMGRLGLARNVQLGPYRDLYGLYMRATLSDILLGCAFLFAALVMLTSSFFLMRNQLKNWISLSILTLSVGVLMVTYEPFLYMFYSPKGGLFVNLFDVSLLVCLSALLYFVEKMFGAGYRGFLRKLRNFQFGYSALCLALLPINEWTGFRYFEIYYFFSVKAFGLMMILVLVVITVITVYHAAKGSGDALILSAGIGVFALVGTGDIIWFYLHAETYDLMLWKFGVVGFVCSLIVLLGRKIADAHNRMIRYSRELEGYNQKLQLSEKIEVISQLAASVAHEVRNPLQVSRGFLQLLRERAEDDKERTFMKLAIEELDRASIIIANYLSFAKPQYEELQRLHLSDELKRVEGMLIPIADSLGARIELNVPEGLYVEGNRAKLKQVFINLIKNSLEALGSDGLIRLWAYEQDSFVFIHVADNGEGMDEQILARLGEPYVTGKSNGTGLGLTASFRIVEAMRGDLKFSSSKGSGTEAVIRFPAAISAARHA